MRMLLLLAAVLGLLWLLVPMGFNKVSDPDAPTTSADAIAKFHQAGRAMINAANRLENSPCDPSLRPALRAAAIAYLRARPDRDTPMTEEETQVISGATYAGIVKAEDWLGPFAFLAKNPQTNAAAGFDTSIFAGGKYSCENGDDSR